MHKNRKISWIFTIAFIFGIIFSLPAVPVIAACQDISDHWAKPQVEYLMAQKIINGYPDNTFRPENPISRAEFIVITNKAFNFSASTTINYSDVKPTDWFAVDIARAKAGGYISGYKDGTMKPNQQISRQEAASIVARILSLQPVDTTATLQGFSDGKTIANWSRDSIAAMVENGYLNGYPDNSFKPTNSIKRAEAAVIFSTVLSKQDGKVVEKPSEPEVQNLFEKAGTYGPKTGTQVINENVTISASGVILQNTIVKGDLTISSAVADGNVELDNIKVKGTTNIYGGGENSLTLNQCELNRVVVNKRNGKIRIVLSRDSSIKTLVVDSGLKLLGSGKITDLTINSSGVEVEPKPINKPVIKSGISAWVGGEKISSRTPGNGGGGGTKVTTANVSSAAELTTALDNSNITTINLTANFNASPTVTRSLTINFGAYTLTGNVNFTHNGTGTSVLKGNAAKSIVGNLTVNTPKASFNNGVTVGGTVNVADVAPASWTESADGNTITITDPNGATITITGTPGSVTVAANAGGNLTITVNPGASVTNVTINAPNVSVVGAERIDNLNSTETVNVDGNDKPAGFYYTIATNSTIANGATNPTVTVTGINFAAGIGSDDLIVDVGTTGLVFSDITRASAAEITVKFTGTAAAGNVTIQARTSAFNPPATEATNTLNITVPAGTVTVTGISVKTPPSNVTYNAGDALDLTGLVVTLTKSDASSEEVAFADFAAKGITASPTNGATLATTDTKVTLTHTASGKSVEQAVTVNAAPVTVSGISVKTAPTKVTYNAGDTLDLIGLVVTLTKSDASSEEVAFADFAAKGITASPTNGATLATTDTKVTLTYTASGKSVEQAITVNAADEEDYNRSYPVMAYDSVNKRYLMVFLKHSFSEENIYGRFVATDGKYIGDEFSICDSQKKVNINHINAAYDSANQKFLVVWTRSSGGTDEVYGQILLQDGGKFGELFAVTSPDDNKRHSLPYLAYDINKRFLVIYRQDKLTENYYLSADVYGRFLVIGEKGPSVGEPFAIAISAGKNWIDNLAFNGQDKFVFPLGNYSSNTKYLCSVDASTGNKSVGYNITTSAQRIALAFDENNKKFLAAWYSEPKVNEGKIVARFFNQDGSVDGDVFQISEGFAKKGNSSVGYADGEFYVAWEDKKSDNDSDIFARIINSDTREMSSQIEIAVGTEKSFCPFVCGSDNSAVIAWTVGQGALDVIGLRHLVPPAPVTSATIDPATGSFDKKNDAQDDVTTTITWGDATLVNAVKNGDATLAAVDYTVDGTTLTIKKDYLVAQAVGEVALSIEFDKGDAATLTITVTDTTPAKVATPEVTVSKDSAANREAGITFSVTAAEGVTFYYTLDGSNPTNSSTPYTDTVTLSAPESNEETRITIKVIGIKAGSTDSEVAEKTVTYAAKPTPVTVTGIEVKTAPDKVTYTAGETLDLTGLVVTLNKSDASSEDVALVDFESKGITTSPAHGAFLVTTHTKVTLTHTASSKSVEQAITVAAADPAVTDMNLAVNEGLQVGNVNVAANAEIGRLSVTGGTPAFTYELVADTETPANSADNTSFAIAADKLKIAAGGALTEAKDYKITVKVTDSKVKTFTKGFTVTVATAELPAQSGSPAFTVGTPATYNTQLIVGAESLTTKTNLTYTWYRSDNATYDEASDTQLATGTTYTPVVADVGKYLIVVAKTPDATGSGTVATDAVVARAAGPAFIAEYAGTFPAEATSINLTGLGASATGLEAAVAINGTDYSDYGYLTVDENGNATITELTDVTTSTKVKVRVKETATHLAGADKEITVTAEALTINPTFTLGTEAEANTAKGILGITDGETITGTSTTVKDYSNFIASESTKMVKGQKYNLGLKVTVANPAAGTPITFGINATDGINYYLKDTTGAWYTNTTVWGPGTTTVNNDAYYTGVTSPVFVDVPAEFSGNEVSVTISMYETADQNNIFGSQTFTFNVIEPTTYAVTFTVTDGTNPITGAEITILEQTLTTDTSGIATIDLENGTYPYGVTATGFDDITNASITVSNAAVDKEVAMTTAGRPAAPKILLAVVKDKDGNSQGTYNADDTLTIIFDKATNQLGSLDKTGVDAIIDWGKTGDVDYSFGTDYSGEWTDARTLVVTAINTTGINFPDDFFGETIAIKIKPEANVKTADGRSNASSSTKVITGGFYQGLTVISSITSPLSNEGALREAPENDGSLRADLDYLLVTLGYNTGKFEEDIASGVTANNLPKGLGFTVEKQSANQLKITLTGKAENHAGENSIDNLSFTFSASKINGAIGDITTLDIELKFIDQVIMDPVISNVSETGFDMYFRTVHNAFYFRTASYGKVAIGDLGTSELQLKNGETPVTINSIEITDEGKTYKVNANLTLGNTYTLNITENSKFKFLGNKSVVAKLTPVVDTPVSATPVIKDQPLSDSILTGTFKDPETDASVAGILAWDNPETVVDKTGNYLWKFTPSNTTDYTVTSGTVNVTANTAIDSVAVTLSSPAIGQPGGAATVAESADYTHTSTVWSEKEEEPFAAGETPVAVITLEAKEGYLFTGLTADKITVDGGTVSYETEQGVSKDGKTLVFTVTYSQL